MPGLTETKRLDFLSFSTYNSAFASSLDMEISWRYIISAKAALALIVTGSGQTHTSLLWLTLMWFNLLKQYLHPHQLLIPWRAKCFGALDYS